MTVSNDHRSIITEADALAMFITDKCRPMFDVLINYGNLPAHVAVTYINTCLVHGWPTTAEAAHNLIAVSAFADAQDATITHLGATA